MQLPRFSLFMLTTDFAYSMVASTDWIDAIAKRIEKEEPDQVTIFVYNKSELNNTVIDEVMTKVGMRVSVALVDVSQIIATGDNRSLSLPMLESPTRNSIFVTIHNHIDKNYWNLLIFINYKATTNIKRPKLLSIMLKSAWYTRSRKLYGIINPIWGLLRYANYSCVILESGARVSVASYDPYLRIFRWDDFDDSIDLFPTRPGNYSDLVIRHSGNTRGSYAYGQRTFPNKVFLQEKSFLDGYFGKYLGARVEHAKHDRRVNWQRDEINIQSDGCYRITSCGRDQHFRLCSVPAQFMEIVVVVPKLPVTGFRITSSILEMLFNFVLFFIIIKIFVLVAEIMHFPETTWNFFNLYQLIVNSTPLVPNSLSEKIIYITIAFLSVVCISDFILVITELNLTSNEMPLNTWKEIDAANLVIYAQRNFDWKQVENMDDSTRRRLQNKTKYSTFTDVSQFCLLDFRAKDRICIADLDQYLQVKNKLHIPTFPPEYNSEIREQGEFLKYSKISEVYSNVYPLVIAVEPRFPLIDELNEAIQRAFETGQVFVFSDWNAFFTEKVSIEDDDSNEQQNFLLPFAMLFFGLFAASLALILERHRDWRNRRIVHPSQ